LIEAVWAGQHPRTAQHSVQAYVSALRRTLGGVSADAVIETRPRGYVLHVPAGAVDVDRFEDLVARARDASAGKDGAHAVELLEQALGLWRGDALGDLAYEPFTQEEQRRLGELRTSTLEALGAALLEVGDPAEAVRVLREAAAADPLRERVCGLLIQALNRCGRQAEALRRYDDFRQVLDEELGLRPSPELQLLQERVLLQDPALGAPPRAPSRVGAEVTNPYKGLRAFEESDAADFHGRGAVVASLVGELGRHPLVTLVGPSGSGKSSVLHAGLAATLLRSTEDDDTRWQVVSSVPGAHPADAIRLALDRLRTEGAEAEPARRRLLVIDQFEEVFTLAGEAQRREALDLLVDVAATGRPLVVLGMRGDFFDSPFTHPPFAEVFRAGVMAMPPLSAAEVEQTIRRPAEARGVPVEPGLVAELVTELVAQPGALPQLQTR
jgi:DNA-binding SARP family transcriptional activator